jgi:hypothetical protein
MRDQEMNSLLDLLGDPRADPDRLAFVVIQCFGPLIAHVVPPQYHAPRGFSLAMKTNVTHE